MEKTGKRVKKPAVKVSEELIKSAFKEQYLLAGKPPASVYKFCVDIGIKEEDFYSFFGSFDSLERSIWNDFIAHTTRRLQSDESFSQFTARERVLTLYFVLFEEIRPHRSYILLQLQQIHRMEITPPFLREFRKTFETFVSSILAHGNQSGEVATRPFVTERYPLLFWMHFGFLLMFWKNDDSRDFEKTDVAIEKSVNLAFDLIGKGAIDSAIDFGKFLYQNR
jgi:hypothetical protein